MSCFTLSVRADVVIIETREGGQHLEFYQELNGNWQNSSAKSSAPGTTGTRGGSRFATQDGSAFQVSPILEHAGGAYLVEVTHGRSSNIPVDLMVGVSATGGSGLPSETDAFNQQPDNVWRIVGTITLDPGVNQPIITFTKLPGASGTGQRFYADAIRFTFAGDPCLSVPEIATVNGPLAAGQTYVDVPTVMSNAAAVVVYADGVEIGRRTEDITGGIVRVPTAPLVKGQIITATQIDANGVESCRPTTGPMVGGGPNPRVRISLSIRQNTSLSGPIGANGGTTGLPVVFLGATNVFGGGFGLAPMGGKVFQPDYCWQTVTFQRGPDPANPIDPTYAWAGSTGTDQLLGNFGILDAIAFAIDDLSDTGPFRIYIDDLRNGDVLIQDFESATNGQPSVLFVQPSFSGTTSPFLLAQPPGNYSPNISQVTDEQADSGNHSLVVSWQFKDVAGGNWLRLVAQGSGTPNPQLDLRLPISFRMLLLPVGATNPPLQICTQPEDVAVMEGETVRLHVTAIGTPPLSYQWYHDGQPVSGATSKTLVIAEAQARDAGEYHVVVTDPAGSITSQSARVIVESLAYDQMLVPLWSLGPTDRPYLGLDYQQSGLAYNPVSGHLELVVHGPEDAILVLDADTGADVGSLSLASAEVSGGIYLVHRVQTASDGTIYACNLTTNAAVEPLKIYSWFDEMPGGGPFLVWEGNPGGLDDTDRWGDTFDMREVSLAGSLWQEFLLGAGRSSRLSILLLGLSETLITVTNIPPGAFSHGLAWGEGYTVWAKSQHGALYHIALDVTNATATVLAEYPNWPAMGPLEVEPDQGLLGGLFVDTPDAFWLFDLANGPRALDTAPFGTDNPNPPALGAVAFGNGRVYALDSNNGLMALAIRPLLRMSRTGNTLTLEWNGPAMLQSAENVTGPYTDVTGATSPFEVNVSEAGQRYYRLRQ